MVTVVFSYDTEEYQAPWADEATKVWTDLLTKYNLRGCFCIVGEKARVLRDRNRQDIIDALKEHEINYHSNLHSVHPTHAEYLNELSWDDGVRRCLMEETIGISDLWHIMERRPTAYCKPGNSWGPQVAYSMSILGLPVFTDAPIEFSPGHPMWFCNQLCLKYHLSFEESMNTNNLFEHMKNNFLNTYTSRTDGYLIMYSHPCCMMASAFGDVLNFKDGKNTPKAQWAPIPKRPKADVIAIREATDLFLEFVANEKIPIATYQEIHAKYIEKDIWISLETAMNILDKVSYELTYHYSGSIYLSPAEIFGVATFILDEYNHIKKLPSVIPVRRPIGPTEDTISEAPTQVSLATFLNCASQTNQTVSSYHRVPSIINLGSIQISPGDFLKTAAHLIRKLSQLPKPNPWVTIEQANNLPTLAEREDFKNMRIGGWLMTPDFHADNVVTMAKRQTWTAKPAVSIDQR